MGPAGRRETRQELLWRRDADATTLGAPMVMSEETESARLRLLAEYEFCHSDAPTGLTQAT